MSLFSKNLRFLRKKGSHNQDDIAILFGKRANTIGNWENRKSEPSLRELMKLADFFKVSTEDLLHRDLEFQRADEGAPDLSTEPAARADAWPEMTATATGEAGADAFWLILREL